jgi:FAD/FMN-containing dehydrogenase
LQRAIVEAKAAGRSISIAGGRHAMGGQQFGEDGVLVDTRALNRVLAFDDERGVIMVEGGIQWPELVRYLDTEQEGRGRQWGTAPRGLPSSLLQYHTSFTVGVCAAHVVLQFMVRSASLRRWKRCFPITSGASKN